MSPPFQSSGDNANSFDVRFHNRYGLRVPFPEDAVTPSDGAKRTCFFICVNYNGSSFTELWLRSVLAQRLQAPQLRIVPVIVDNASTPEEAERLRRFTADVPGVQVVRSDANVGYFGGLNLGLDAVTPTGDDLVVIGNNDLEFAADFCARLDRAEYRDDVLVVCPDLLTADGVHQNPHVLHRTNWLRRLKFDIYFSHYLANAPTRWLARQMPSRKSRGSTPGSAGEISMGVGACYVLMPKFLRKTRRLFFPAFLYGEEACLAWQVLDAGGITWYDPSLQVAHAESAACSKLPSRTAYEYGREAYWRYRHLL